MRPQDTDTAPFGKTIDEMRHSPSLLPLVFLCSAIALLFSAEWNGKSYFQPDAENFVVLVSEALNICAYAVCAVKWRTFERLFFSSNKTSLAAPLAAGTAAALGRLLLASTEGGTAIGALDIVGIALHSLTEPILLLACLCLLCQSQPRRARIILPCSFLLAGLAMTLQQFVGLAAGTFLVIAGPLLSAALLLLATKSLVLECIALENATNQEPTSSATRPARMPLWPFVLMVAYDLVYHLVITIDTATSPYGMFGLVALSAAAVALALIKKSDYSPLPLNKAALPCVVAALMCLTMPWPGPKIAALLSNTGSAAFYLFALITFIMMCQRHEFIAPRSLGAFLAIEHTGHFLGDLAGQIFNQAFPNGELPLQIFAMLVATAMVLVATLFFNDMEVARIFGLVPRGVAAYPQPSANTRHDNTQAVVSVMSKRESVAWQCASAARTYGLTIREEEALELLMLGMGNAQIAEAMTVSPGTVKTHVSHVCRKLGAASRDEAVELAYQV